MVRGQRVPATQLHYDYLGGGQSAAAAGAVDQPLGGAYRTISAVTHSSAPRTLDQALDNGSISS
jgi:hypothetical protein